MLGRGPPEAPPTLPNFDAQNRAIRPISLRGSTGSDMLDGARWGWIGVDRVPYGLRPGPGGSRGAPEAGRPGAILA